MAPAESFEGTHCTGAGQNACDQRPEEYLNHIWSYDILENRLDSGQKVRILNVIDEFTRECLVVEVAVRVRQQDVIDLLRYLFLVRRWSPSNAE